MLSVILIARLAEIEIGVQDLLNRDLTENLKIHEGQEI